MKNQSTFPLRLPRSVKPEVECRVKREGISVNPFIAIAVAEKLATMNTERRERTDFIAFDRLMHRKAGNHPGRRIGSPEGEKPESAVVSERLVEVLELTRALTV